MEDLTGIIGLALYLGLVAFYAYVGWRIYAKAGRPGWAALVPVYNALVLTRIVGRPAWWIVLLLVPVVNLIAALVLSIDLARSFGRGTAYGIGLGLLGFLFGPMLAFGDAEYRGPSVRSGATPAIG
jgi:hypothetical protein